MSSEPEPDHAAGLCADRDAENATGSKHYALTYPGRHTDPGPDAATRSTRWTPPQYLGTTIVATKDCRCASSSPTTCPPARRRPVPAGGHDRAWARAARTWHGHDGGSRRRAAGHRPDHDDGRPRQLHRRWRLVDLERLHPGRLQRRIPREPPYSDGTHFQVTLKTESRRPGHGPGTSMVAEAYTDEPRHDCISTAATRPGSATAPRTSGSRPPARPPTTPRASACRTSPTCPIPGPGRRRSSTPISKAPG